jgi:hypothetical protein
VTLLGNLMPSQAKPPLTARLLTDSNLFLHLTSYRLIILLSLHSIYVVT